MLSVVSAGLQTVVVDGGRAGFAHLGVPRSGALDPGALAAANAMVGNAPDAAGVECLLRGPVLRAPGWRLALVSGEVREWAHSGVLDARRLPGLRAWIAVEGGIAVEPVLGSRSSDLLGGIGPAPLVDGDELPLRFADPASPADLAGWKNDVVSSAADPAPGGPLMLLDGPDPVRLDEGPWVVSAHSDRTALRLDGPARPHALPGRTRGLVPGAVQVPPDGRPVVFLAGHPATGGYPIAGFVRSADLPRLAQLRPGQTLTLGPSRPRRVRRR